MSEQPTELLLDRIPSPLGQLFIVCDGAGRLRALDFDDCGERFRRLLRRHYGGLEPVVAAAPAPLRAALMAYFDGEVAAVEGLEVDTNGSAFQRRVWSALRRIPAGATATYGQLAAAIAQPKASRAVGLANGANPIAIVVPCHRVIGAGGALTGFGGGLERKRWLLEHEERWTRGVARACA